MLFSIQAILGATFLYAGWLTLDRHLTGGVVLMALGLACSVGPILQGLAFARQVLPVSPRTPEKRKSPKIIELQRHRSHGEQEKNRPTIH